jgi:hypothetical protein
MSKTASEILHDLLEDYEFRGDTDHVPTDGERTMLEDFGLGLIEALGKAGLIPPVAQVGDREAVAYVWTDKDNGRQLLAWGKPMTDLVYTCAPLVYAATPAQPAEERAAMVDAIDVADRLIERAFGTDKPQDWEDAFRKVVEARRKAALSRTRTGSEAQNG